MYLSDLAKRNELPSWMSVPKPQIYTCIVCGNQVKSEFEPVCTGPHPSLDEHEPVVMQTLLFERLPLSNK
jgi:hypothetical protein